LLKYNDYEQQTKSSTRSLACDAVFGVAGFVWNGLWVLELAAVGDSRVSIEGDVKLELTSFRPHHSRSPDVAWRLLFSGLEDAEDN